MEEIKLAFQKVKQDIFSLGQEVHGLRSEITELKSEINLILGFLDDLKLKMAEKTPTHTPTHPKKTPTNQQIIPTHNETPTDKLLSQVLKRQNTAISTGNRGVPTDRQTNQQTDRHIIQHIKPEELDKKDHLANATAILNSLDSLKKDVRIKFKRLTSKEIAVFSLLYNLENQGEIVDYPLLSTHLNLSESSIRDYIGKIQKKGIPIIKEKLNNKKIFLHISPDLKKIATLDTIIKLRNL